MKTTTWYARTLVVLLMLSSLPSCREQAYEEASSSHNLEHRLKAYIQPLVENRDFSGVVRIIQGDQLLFEETWGYTDFEQNIEHSIDSRFAIASISKTVTAAAIIKLKSEGRISYDDLVNKHLPSFRHGNKIRISHLLRFESGLAEIDSEKKFTSQALLDEVGSYPLEFEPGTDSRYGNSGFDVLAVLIERVSQMSFEDYLHSTFFEPLKMTGSGLRRELESTDQTLVGPHIPGPPPSLVFKGSFFQPVQCNRCRRPVFHSKGFIGMGAFNSPKRNRGP